MVQWVAYEPLNGIHVSKVTGRTSTENFERPGRSLLSRTDKNVKKVRQVIHDDMERNVPKVEYIIKPYHQMNFHPTCI